MTAAVRKSPQSATTLAPESTPVTSRDLHVAVTAIKQVVQASISPLNFQLQELREHLDKSERTVETLQNELNELRSSADLMQLWLARPCWICSVKGFCAHRQPDLDLARIESYRRQRSVA